MLATVIGWTISIHSYWLEKGILPTDHTPCEEQLWVDSVEKVRISGWKKATLALVSEPGHH
ncbi:hypothetical protein V2K56_19385, partial [Pseudomonas alliivorans]|nr:hypothetical protein [Pseudomonas alliivorans]